MSTPDKIKLVTDRLQRAKNLLLYQFQGKKNLEILLTTIMNEVQELENTINDVQTVRTLEGSYGWWLDKIGEKLNVSRGNYTDEQYKTAIKIAMYKKTASATIDNIIKIVFLLTNDGSVKIENNYPYLMELFGYLTCVSDDKQGLKAIADLFPVNTAIKIVKYNSNTPFQFGVTDFSSNAILSSLVYHKYGTLGDQRFIHTPNTFQQGELPVAPYVISSPYIYGDNQQGSILNIVDGEWGGDTPITFSYQWLRDNSDIVGETNNTYVVKATDLGTNISCKVTASNNAGSKTYFTNAIAISSTPPVVNDLTNNLGLRDIYSSSITDGVVTATATVSTTFNSDGTTALVEDGVTTNDQWLNTIGAGVGSDYELYYEVVNGNQFSNLNPLEKHNLGTNLTLSISISGTSSDVETGTYKFTIRKISDPTVVQSFEITMTAELINTF